VAANSFLLTMLATMLLLSARLGEMLTISGDRIPLHKPMMIRDTYFRGLELPLFVFIASSIDPRPSLFPASRPPTHPPFIRFRRFALLSYYGFLVQIIKPTSNNRRSVQNADEMP